MTEPASMVRFDPAIGLAGLFRPLQARQCRDSCNVTQRFNGFDIEWRSPEALGIPEQTLLLALALLAAPGSQRLSMQPTSQVGRELRAALSAKGELLQGDTASIHTSLSELARLCGYAEAGGANLEQVRRMLRRLAKVTVWMRTPDFEASSNLLAVVIARSGRIRVALNARLGRSAWGEAHYVSISLAERLTLPTQTAMALHAHLSAVIRIGRSHAFEWPRLERAVWGDNASGSTFRARKAKLRVALAAIGSLCWSVAVQGEVVRLHRHSSNGSPAERQQRPHKKPLNFNELRLN